MDYFYFNTDADSIKGAPRFSIMIEMGFAATSGPIKYGEQLRTISPNDILLMYHNGLGVVAFGRVRENWDETTHSIPIYYVPQDSGFDHEYRIKVDWFHNLSKSPVSIGELKKRIGWTSSKVIQKIVSAKAEAQRLVSELTAPLSRPIPDSSLPDDIMTILDLKIETTVKGALINARVGQGKFRNDVLKLWGNRCAVTGAATTDVIRASHIKPWRDSTNNERLDPANGLPLVANLDALFDAGLISFGASGEMIVSPKLCVSERQFFQLHRKSLTNTSSPQTAIYLECHRCDYFQK